MTTTSTNREELLAQINAQLAERHLKPMRKLGDHTKREIEVTGIIAFHDHSKRFFTDVQYAVLFPNKQEGVFTVRYNANGDVADGAVIVVVINGKFAIVHQWRLPLGVWTFEHARGFSDKLDAAQLAGNLGNLKIADLPLGTLVRELSEEVMANAEVTSVTHLGNIAENSGTSAIAPSYFLVQLSVDESKLDARVKGSEDGLAVKLWDAATLRREIGKKVCDNHSITATFLAMNYIESLPR